MKLIHLPTGETEAWRTPHAVNLLKYKPNIYIRAELPEYWRIEGYDKSLEWARNQPAYDPSEHRWEFVTNKKGRNVFDKEISDVTFMQLPEISRAEFEYHIYNPWKYSQAPEFKVSRETQNPWAVDPTDGMFKPVRDFKGSKEQLDMSDIDKLRQQAEQIDTTFAHKREMFSARLQKCKTGEWIGQVHEVKGAMSQSENKGKLIENLKKAIDTIRAAEREVDRSAWKTPSPLYKHMAENHNVALLGSEENDIKQIVLSDLDTLKQQAEKMGYELVRKKVNWQDECYNYEISLSGVMVTDLMDDESIFINHLQMPILIQKYNQFKSYEGI